MVKSESDINDSPFKTVKVHCNKSIADNLNEQIDQLKKEKEALVKELVAVKTENQKIYFSIKDQQRVIEEHEIAKTEFQQQLADQEKMIKQLNRDLKVSKAKVQQLIACVDNNQNGSNNKENAKEECDDYEVEAIVGHKGKKGNRHFLIRWKGFLPEDDTWEKEANLNCPKILSEYLKSLN